MNLGVPEIILILVVALLFFGPSRLPSLGKSVGEAIRGFKKGLSGINSDEEKDQLHSSGRGTPVENLGAESHEKKKETRDV